MTVLLDAEALSAAQQDDELTCCIADSWYFLATYGLILDRDLGPIPFAPWDYLRDTLVQWDTYRRSVELKARQLGISWLAAGYALWTAKFQHGANVLMTSVGERDAALLLAKCRFIEDNLPSWLRWERGKDNDSELDFALMESSILALPSTGAAGRGHSATLVVMDEFAYHANAETNLAAILPTVTERGRVLVISTANGYGNPFQKLWDEAPGNGWHPHFLNWRERPGRDDAWLEAKAQELSLSADKLKQEYPATANEAFLASGRTYFQAEDVRFAFEQAQAGKRPGSSFRGLDRYPVTLYRAPDPSGVYLIGADPSKGSTLGRTDASCCIVLDLNRCEEVAHLHGQVPPSEFAEGIDALARLYPGLVAPEINNHGQMVLTRLRELAAYGVPWTLYQRVSVEQQPTASYQPDKSAGLGWHTTEHSKLLALDELEEALRQHLLRLHSPNLKKELLSYLHLDNGKAGAPDGGHDDCVIGLAIAWQLRKWLMQHRERLPAAGGLATSFAVSGVG